jgi:hypothetical protein
MERHIGEIEMTSVPIPSSGSFIRKPSFIGREHFTPPLRHCPFGRAFNDVYFMIEEKK